MKVLHVEDNASVRQAMGLILREAGYEVEEAGDGMEALLKVKKARPDLVLLDLDLPGGMNGVKVCLELKADPATAAIPVVMLSARSTKENVVQALKAGAADFLVKGMVTIETLSERIGKALRKPMATPAPPSRATKSEVKLVTPGELARRLQSRATVKALPFFAAEVVAIQGTDLVSTGTLIRAIERDPWNAERFLRLAAVTRPEGGGAARVAEAVGRTGVAGGRALALALAVLREHVPAGTPPERIEAWVHGLAAGTIAARWTDPEGGGGGTGREEALVTGLLHDVGRLFLAEAFPQPYAAVLDSAAASGDPVYVVETRLLGVTHAAVGRRLLEGWGFPPPVVEPVARHHDDWAELKRSAPGARLAAANSWAKKLGLGQSADSKVADVPEEIAVLTGLASQAVQEKAAELQVQVDALAAALLPPRAPAAPPTPAPA